MQRNRGMQLRSLTPSMYAKWMRHSKSPRQSTTAAHGGPATPGARVHRRNRSLEGHSRKTLPSSPGHSGIQRCKHHSKVPHTARRGADPRFLNARNPMLRQRLPLHEPLSPPTCWRPATTPRRTPNLPFSRMMMEDFSATPQTLALKIKLWTFLGGDLNEKKHVHEEDATTPRAGAHTHPAFGQLLQEANYHDTDMPGDVAAGFSHCGYHAYDNHLREGCDSFGDPIEWLWHRASAVHSALQKNTRDDQHNTDAAEIACEVLKETNLEVKQGWKVSFLSRLSAFSELGSTCAATCAYTCSKIVLSAMRLTW